MEYKFWEKVGGLEGVQIVNTDLNRGSRRSRAATEDLLVNVVIDNALANPRRFNIRALRTFLHEGGMLNPR